MSHSTAHLSVLLAVFVLVSQPTEAQTQFLGFPLGSAATPVHQGFYYGNGTYHGGQDYLVPSGTDVLAAADGYAIASCQPPMQIDDYSSFQFGRFVFIDHGNGYTSLYAHLESATVPELPCEARHQIKSGPILYNGTTYLARFVRAGEVIGKSGRSGTPLEHLHFEVSRSDGTWNSHRANRVDAYDLRMTSQHYPPPGTRACGAAHLWTTCPPSVASSNRRPTGAMGGIDSLNQVFGWGIDPDDPNEELSIHFFIDRNAGHGVAPDGTVTTSLDATGRQSFDWAIPVEFHDGRDHAVHAWVIDLTDPSLAVELDGSPQRFNIAATSQPPTAGFTLSAADEFVHEGEVLSVAIVGDGTIDVHFDARCTGGTSYGCSRPEDEIVSWFWTIVGPIPTIVSLQERFSVPLVSGQYSVTLVVMNFRGVVSEAAHGAISIGRIAGATLPAWSALPNSGTGAEGLSDPYWSLLSGPRCPAGSCSVFAAVADGFPIGPFWTSNNSVSRWIEPLSGTTDGHPEGDYTYRLRFTVADDEVSSVVIRGRWATDDAGVDILVNGVSTGLRTATPFAFHPFVISQSFQAGVNTLDFVVRNRACNPGENCEATNPTGLRVEFGFPRSTGTAAWPMFGRDPHHTGASPFVGPRNLTTTPSVSMPVSTLGLVDTDATPLIGPDGVIYAATNQAVHAYYPDGTAVPGWPVLSPNGGVQYKMPAIGEDGTVYAAFGGSLYAINPDGSLKWPSPVAGSFLALSSPPTISSDGTIYLTNGGPADARLYAINPDGSVKWQIHTGMAGAPTVTDDGTILVRGGTSGGGGLSAINPNGAVRWSLSFSGTPTHPTLFATPAIGADGTIYVSYRRSSPSGPIEVLLVALDPSTGQARHPQRLLPGVTACNVVLSPDGTVVCMTSNDHIFRFPANLGTAVLDHVFTATSPRDTLTIGGDGTIYAALNDAGLGRMVAIAPDGTWTEYVANDGARFTGGAISGNGTLFFGAVPFAGPARIVGFGNFSPEL